MPSRRNSWAQITWAQITWTESDERLGPLVSLRSLLFLATVTRGIEPDSDSDSVRVPVEIVWRKIKVGRAPCLALPGAPPVLHMIAQQRIQEEIGRAHV